MVQFDENRLAEYCRRNGIVRLRMFGSAARGEERPDSDVDLIADFGVPIGFFELIRAEDDLASFFGRPVDLLTPSFSGTCSQQWNEIPWREITGIRHKLIHDYFEVDLGIVWQTATVNVPEVLPLLRNTLEQATE